MEFASSERDRRNLEFALCKVRAESEVLKQTSAQSNFGNQQLFSLQEKLEIAEKQRNELASRVNSYRETEEALAVALKEIVTLKESIT